VNRPWNGRRRSIQRASNPAQVWDGGRRKAQTARSARPLPVEVESLSSFRPALLEVLRNPAMMRNDNFAKMEEQSRRGRAVRSGSGSTAPQFEGVSEANPRFRIVAIERECACGAATIASKLADILGWKLWDQLLARELADSIRSDLSAAQHRVLRVDERFSRLAQVFWRGSYERSAEFGDCQCLDPAHMVAVMQRVSDKIAREGNAVVVGRGAPGFFQHRPDTFRVFLYAPREERIRHLIANGKSESDAALVEAVDRERSAFVKHYFGVDWPTRSVYDLMINTAMGEDNAISTILHTMRRLQPGS
jgi:cytidylate kinase